MLNDIDFEKEMAAKFFRAIMRDGIIEVPLCTFQRQSAYIW